MQASDLGKILNTVIGKEPEAIIRTLAMMAYNPAIGRVLEKNGVWKFADLMVALVPGLYGDATRESFERWHETACDEMIRSFQTARNQTLSYGQAQKPINVFLKVYVDFAHQPEPTLAQRLAAFLHCPLDRLVMSFIRREFESEYEKHIGKLRARLLDQVTERVAGHAKNARSLARMVLGDEFALAAINRELYIAWQTLLRSLYPAKPVLLDIIWVLERNGQKKASAASVSRIE
jgi:hypothetical protein